MANLTPTSSTLIAYPSFDQGLGRAKKGLDYNRENVVLGTLGCESNLFNIASIGASQANTTVQGYVLLPGRVKIPKITVFCSAISAISGTLSFNIVLGTGAYTQGSVPGNDNSSVPPVAYNLAGEATSQQAPGIVAPYPAGGGGIASNPAVAGNAMFAADVLFNVTNFPARTLPSGAAVPALTTASGTGATYGFQFAPASPDAVWPNAGVLTLRVTTPSGGSITNLIISAYMEPEALSASWPSSGGGTAGIPPEPTIDY